LSAVEYHKFVDYFCCTLVFGGIFHVPSNDYSDNLTTLNIWYVCHIKNVVLPGLPFLRDQTRLQNNGIQQK